MARMRSARDALDLFRRQRTSFDAFLTVAKEKFEVSLQEDAGKQIFKQEVDRHGGDEAAAKQSMLKHLETQIRLQTKRCAPSANNGRTWLPVTHTQDRATTASAAVDTIAGASANSERVVFGRVGNLSKSLTGPSAASASRSRATTALSAPNTPISTRRTAALTSTTQHLASKSDDITTKRYTPSKPKDAKAHSDKGATSTPKDALQQWAKTMREDPKCQTKQFCTLLRAVHHALQHARKENRVADYPSIRCVAMKRCGDRHYWDQHHDKYVRGLVDAIRSA